MSGRIAARFARLKEENRAGLIPFLMGGDPDAERSAAILHALPEAGADLIEIGVPFSDPMADGPVIEEAGLRALKGGATLSSILAMVAQFRTQDTETPVILMGYYNPIFHMGIPAFCQRAAQSGVDGVIVVDLPPEEEAEFTGQAKEAGLDFIRLIAPTSGEARLSRILSTASGFVYSIAIAGITGAKGADAQALKARVGEIKEKTTLPVAVGFGIKTPTQAAETGAFADAVVVGSALVQVIEQSHGSAQEAAAFVRSLSAALKKR